MQASYRLKLFGIEPKVALLSHSNYGSHENASAAKMREVWKILKVRAPKLEMDGEMQADTAWDEALRQRMFPNTTLSGRANLFVMPNLDAANIAYNIVRVMTDGVAIGPILMGVDKPAHILTPSSTVRRVVNMTAIAVVDAQIRAAKANARADLSCAAAGWGGFPTCRPLRTRRPRVRGQGPPSHLPYLPGTKEFSPCAYVCSPFQLAGSVHGG